MPSCNCQVTLQSTLGASFLVDFIEKNFPPFNKLTREEREWRVQWSINQGFCIVAAEHIVNLRGRRVTLYPVACLLIRPTDNVAACNDSNDPFYFEREGNICFVDLYIGSGFTYLKDMWDLAVRTIGPKEYVAFGRDLNYDKLSLVKERILYAKLSRS